MKTILALLVLVAAAFHLTPASGATPLGETTIGFDGFKRDYGNKGLGNFLPALVVHDSEGGCRGVLTPTSFGKLEADINAAFEKPAGTCSVVLAPEFEATLRSERGQRDAPALHLIVLDHPGCIGCTKMREEVAALGAEAPQLRLFVTIVSMDAAYNQNRAKNDGACPTCDKNAAD